MCTLYYALKLTECLFHAQLYTHAAAASLKLQIISLSLQCSHSCLSVMNYLVAIPLRTHWYGYKTDDAMLYTI